MGTSAKTGQGHNAPTTFLGAYAPNFLFSV